MRGPRTRVARAPPQRGARSPRLARRTPGTDTGTTLAAPLDLDRPPARRVCARWRAEWIAALPNSLLPNSLLPNSLRPNGLVSEALLSEVLLSEVLLSEALRSVALPGD